MEERRANLRAKSVILLYFVVARLVGANRIRWILKKKFFLEKDIQYIYAIRNSKSTIVTWDIMH